PQPPQGWSYIGGGTAQAEEVPIDLDQEAIGRMHDGIIGQVQAAEVEPPVPPAPHVPTRDEKMQTLREAIGRAAVSLASIIEERDLHLAVAPSMAHRQHITRYY